MTFGQRSRGWGIGQNSNLGYNDRQRGGETPICPMPALTLRRCFPMADPMASRQRGQRRMPRVRGLLRCPHGGHFSHSDSRAFAESCAELSQRLITPNRKNLQGVRKDGCPSPGHPSLRTLEHEKEAFGTHRRSVSKGIGRIGVCSFSPAGTTAPTPGLLHPKSQICLAPAGMSRNAAGAWSRFRTTMCWGNVREAGSSGIMVDGEDCREIVARYLENGECASIRPPPRGGCRPKEEGLWLASAERVERAAGGVLRMAVDAGCRRGHPQRDWFFCGRWKVVLAATAERSPPPVAAPVAFLLQCIRLPLMAAPPPSRRGASSCRPSCSLHSWSSVGGSTSTA